MSQYSRAISFMMSETEPSEMETTRMNWAKQMTTLSDLRRSAFRHRDMRSTMDWLKKEGLVPEDVKKRRVAQARVDLDPKNIPVGYLADSAYEWDSWGESSPVEFVKAMGMETRGSTARDLISETLALLGREQKEAAA